MTAFVIVNRQRNKMSLDRFHDKRMAQHIIAILTAGHAARYFLKKDENRFTLLLTFKQRFIHIAHPLYTPQFNRIGLLKKSKKEQ